MNNIYGYIRVSTISQREDRQWAALAQLSGQLGRYTFVSQVFRNIKTYL